MMKRIKGSGSFIDRWGGPGYADRGFQITTTYDDSREVTTLHLDGSGNVLASYRYTYDPGSRVTSQTINGATTNYGYDAINELTQDGSTTYGYDANENRLGHGVVIGPNNELLSDGHFNYSYDNEGNLLQKVAIASGATTSYNYDNNNHLTSVVETSGSGKLLRQIDYTLDVFGNRVKQAITGSNGKTRTLRFAYDNAEGVVPNIWADLSATGSLTTRRIFGDGLDEPLARIDATGTAWYLTDHLGSIMALMNNAGVLIDQVTYDAFGNVLTESKPAAGDRYKYAGMQLGPDGLDHTPGRDLRTRTGRWNQQDAMGVSGANPNLYPYVGNEPTDATDARGQDRYYLRPSWHHISVGVDTWDFKDFRWEKTGQLTFHFVAVGIDQVPNNWGWDTPLTLMWKGGAFVNRYPCCLVAAKAQVVVEKGLPTGPKTTLRSAPAQDIAMLKKIKEFSKKPGAYNLLTYNCVHFAVDALKWGLDAGGLTLPGKLSPGVIVGIAKDVFGGNPGEIGNIFRYVQGLIVLDKDGKAIMNEKAGSEVK